MLHLSLKIVQFRAAIDVGLSQFGLGVEYGRVRLDKNFTYCDSIPSTISDYSIIKLMLIP
jgi:hypothetical protein